MSLEDTELTIGGVSFKGVYIEPSAGTVLEPKLPLKT